MYRSSDKKCDEKLKIQEKRIKSLIEKIDHTITPLKQEFLKRPEASETLLSANWAELRKVISSQEFVSQEMQEQINRTITALKTLKRMLWREKIRSLINEVKWSYEVTLKAILISVLDWLSKSRN